MQKNTKITVDTTTTEYSDQMIWEQFLHGDDEAYTYIYKQFSGIVCLRYALYT